MSYQQIAPRTTRETLDFVRHELQMEDRHDIGTTGEPAFAALASNLGAPWEVGGFYLTPFGEVQLYGVVKSTSGLPAPLFTLPTGYRPRGDRIFVSDGGGLFQRVVVTAAGLVSITVGNPASCTLEECRFRVVDR
jgi:hypothetical protein